MISQVDLISFVALTGFNAIQISLALRFTFGTASRSALSTSSEAELLFTMLIVSGSIAVSLGLSSLQLFMAHRVFRAIGDRPERGGLRTWAPNLSVFLSFVNFWFIAIPLGLFIPPNVAVIIAILAALPMSVVELFVVVRWIENG